MLCFLLLYVNTSVFYIYMVCVSVCVRACVCGLFIESYRLASITGILISDGSGWTNNSNTFYIAGQEAILDNIYVLSWSCPDL